MKRTEKIVCTVDREYWCHHADNGRCPQDCIHKCEWCIGDGTIMCTDIVIHDKDDNVEWTTAPDIHNVHDFMAIIKQDFPKDVFDIFVSHLKCFAFKEFVEKTS